MNAKTREQATTQVSAMAEQPETFEPVSFKDVRKGDTVSFSRRDNGFDGSGGILRRTGTVTKVTDKTVTVECNDRWGKTGVLRRADWHERDMHRSTKPPATRPYDAEHVQIVDEGTIVTALYIPDPEQAKDPQAVLDAPPTMDSAWEVEIVAEATRFYKKDGADFSGWIVRSRQDYTDPIPNKRAAMTHLRDAIADYFTR